MLSFIWLMIFLQFVMITNLFAFISLYDPPGDLRCSATMSGGLAPPNLLIWIQNLSRNHLQFCCIIFTQNNFIVLMFSFVPVCHGSVIDNVAAAQKMKGCTIIEGVLEIQIRGGSEGMTLRLWQNLLISIFNFADCVLFREMEGQFWVENVSCVWSL